MIELSGGHVVGLLLLSALHLAAGAGFGFFLAQAFAPPDESQRLERLEGLVQFYRDGFERIARHAEKLSAQASGADREAIPEPLVESVRALAEVTRKIQERSANRGPEPASELEGFHSISRGEMQELVPASRLRGEGPEADIPGSTRYTYDVPQWMARCAGSRLPAVDEFELVNCHDISANGISFYADDVPIGQTVVMAVGIGDAPMFVVAEVMHRRVVTVDNTPTYLVGCRFRRRLSRQTEGNVVDGYSSLPAAMATI
jgi:hypothetical protein